MTEGKEREEYLARLERLEKGITHILDLPANRIVTPEIMTSLESLKKETRLLRKKLESGEFEIAVVGLEKAGKSSFANALADLQILPTADARCTYTSTCIRPGNKNSAVVSFLKKEELEKDFQEKLKLMHISNAESWTLDTLSPEKYEQLFSQTSPEVQKSYGDNLNEDIKELLASKDSLKRYLDRPDQTYEEDELQSASFKGFITDPARAMAVREIVIYSTQLKGMPNAVLYDVPGFDSPTAMHKQQTLEKMNSADAIIAVANAKAPSLTQPALDVFRQTDSDGNALSDKLFVFANKADLIDDSEKLAENIQTTRQQWIDKRKILAPQFANRIIFGSAFAAEGNQAAKDKLNEIGLNGDGIATIRSTLETYNANERFEVLKRRIGKLLFGVRKLFENAGADTVQSSISYDKSYGKIILELVDKLRPALREKLENLKSRTNQDLEKNRPLSIDIDQRISSGITGEKYALNDDEIRKLHEKLVGVNDKAERPSALDTYMRESRFDDMYNSFCEDVQGSTVARHQALSAEIQKLFMETLEVASTQPGYDVLADAVANFCSFDGENDKSYYDSLLERFGRDLFEALVLYSQGQERLNKFKSEMANFFSMGVYYNDGNNVMGDPRDSLFWRLVLYPELAGAPQLDELIEKIKSATGLTQIGKHTQTLLRQFLTQKGHKAASELDSIISSVPKGANEAVVAQALKKGLEAALEEASPDIESILEEGYLSDVQKRRGNYTYKTVQKEWENDIEALRIALKRGFIPAVNLEKAFGARETRRLENIRDRLPGDKFRDFIANNLEIIEAAKVGELKAAESQRMADRAVREEIGGILSTIDRPGAI